MDVILITDFNGVVHGTINDKKTGCNVNLQKPENATKYRRGVKMTNLKEITCEKCSMKIAKELIKADKKEMDKWLKEEKAREKAGYVDESIVPLGNTEAKITKAPEPKPVPEVKEEEVKTEPSRPVQNIPGTNVAIDNDLAQFAVNVPKQEEPEPPKKEEDFLAQFAVNVPKQEEPEPPKKEDDFLAQFAINVPKQEEPEPQKKEDDFLAQFAVEVPKQEEEPAPVNTNDNFLSQFAVPAPNVPQNEPTNAQAALNNDNMASLGGTSAIPSSNDIMSMFAIDGNVNSAFANQQQAEQPVQQNENNFYEQPQQDDNSTASEWDKIASQLFGTPYQSTPVQETLQPVPEPVQEPVQEVAEVYEEPVIEEMDEISAPSTDTLRPAYEERATTPILDDIAPVYEQPQAPVLDDIAPVYEQPQAPVLDDIAPVYEQPKTPVLDDIAPVYEQPQAPVLDDIAPVYEQPQAPVLDDVAPIQEQPQEPILEEVAPIEEQPIVEEEPEKPVKPSVTHTVIIQQRTSKSKSGKQSAKKNNASQQNVQQQAPVQNPIPQSAPVQNVMPQQMQQAPMQNVMPQQMQAPMQQQMGYQQPMQNMNQPQLMNMPQLTGYDQNGQPMYTYVQMQVTGYDQTGQPMLAPYNAPAPQMPYQQQMQPQYNMPMQNQYGMPMQNQYAGMQMQQPQYNMQMNMPMQQNDYSQSMTVGQRIAASHGMSVQQLEAQSQQNKMTVGQKIAAENAAKGSPATANVSQIATNPHSKDTSQAFKSAISQSKEHANESLTDTQGLQANAPIITSIEDMLSQLGDNSEKEKAAQRAALNKNVPVVDEFKAPSKQAQKASQTKSAPKEPERPLTAKELKEKKKQEKIDAKFRKEMEKRK